MKYWSTIDVALFVTLVLFNGSSRADERVKYCKNFKTGEVIVVEAGMPCPFPTVQI